MIAAVESQIKKKTIFPFTHCKRGHELVSENVYINPKGNRQCRICKRESNHFWRKGLSVTTPNTHCRRGHLLTSENSYSLGNGGRFCSLCQQERMKKQYTECGWRFARHGITQQKYQAILKRQNYCCPICHRNLIINKEAIDHDHRTGKVRGILCTNCNTALGKFGDSPNILRRVLEYLIHDGE